MTTRPIRFCCALVSVIVLAMTATAPADRVRNSLGMALVEIPAGSFLTGGTGGEFDELPARRVSISTAFGMGATEVTNTQYEQFDPAHRALRGKDGLSKADDEAVIFVSWDEATAFCKWLGEREGVPYRLPTEAEWEYACRAGTATPFNTGDKPPAGVPANEGAKWYAEAVPTCVGRGKANGFGLFDMHGNVAEWCADWYGPYVEGAANDPVGPAAGEFRVIRGGSHSTLPFYCRSANRGASLPGDRSWLIGFRVVRGEVLRSVPTPPPPLKRWALGVSQEKYDWKAHAPDSSKPYFVGPIPFVKIPPNSDGPLYSKHNHVPDIVACPNGDLLATFYTCRDEAGRELAVAATRLRRGEKEWEPADIFYKAADRNMHATALWTDGKGTLYHFNGLSVGHGWGALALIVRTSADSGATWGGPTWISREHQWRNMPIAGVFGTADGKIVLACDATPEQEGGTALHVSADGGKTWVDPGLGTVPLRPDTYAPGVVGGSIAGIHAGVCELPDGRWMALGRGNAINGHMPKSISSDGGKTWHYSDSGLPPVTNGQRLVLKRLAEGPLLLVSFANEPMPFPDGHGGAIQGTGLFAALSDDNGDTWPTRRLLTPGHGTYDGRGWTGPFTATPTAAEPAGYLAATQSPDGVVQLLSSGLHYRFNAAWVRAAGRS